MYARPVPLRIVVTTRRGVRHLLFLALLEARLGRPPDGVLVQSFGERAASRRSSAARLRTVAGRLVAPRSMNVTRRLARHRLAPRTTVDSMLLDALSPVIPVDIDDLARRSDVRVDPDPNSAGTAAWLEGLDPDVVVVFGGRILRGPWLTPRVAALNVHYGLLPWYGGAVSADYALYHDRGDRVGSTVHVLAPGVDDGPIVARLPVEPEMGTLEDVQTAVLRVGFEAIVEQVELLERGDPQRATPQTGTHVYRRGSQHLAIEAVADLRLRHRTETFPVQRALDRMPRGRGLRGRIAPSSIPPGVYVLLYHSVVDAANAEPWELSFSQVATPLGRFREHVAYLASHLTPTTLGDAFELLRNGPADRPYFALTFDDGYTNLVTNALSVCAEHGVRPTVFAGAAFAAGEAVHYRLLLAELIRRGHAERTAAFLGLDAARLWSESKDAYRSGTTETAVEQAWAELVGEPWPTAHLTFDGLRELVGAGWSVGNHTVRHVPLVGLDADELDRQLLVNDRRLADAGLDPIPWVSYPFGRVTHVDPELDAFMDRNPDLFGIFAAGGVNVVPSRKEWLRLSVEGDVDTARVRDQLFREARATLAALDDLAS